MRALTESRDGDTEATAEVAAVSGISDFKRIATKNEYFKDSSDPRDAIRIQDKSLPKGEAIKGKPETTNQATDEDVLDEDVIETIVSLGYPLEEVIRLLEEEDEEMISLYLRILEDNQNHLRAIYPSYMRSKVSDWNKYAFLLASPENSRSRSRKEKSRNNRVLSYSPKRNK